MLKFCGKCWGCCSFSEFPVRHSGLWLGSACLANCCYLCFCSFFPVWGCLAELQALPLDDLSTAGCTSATQHNGMGTQAEPFFFLGWTQSKHCFLWCLREIFSWMKLFSCVHHLRMFPVMKEQKEAQKKKRKKSLFFNIWKSASTTPTPWWHSPCSWNRGCLRF